ncbi:hypothetical protein OJ997_03475 [Solirubrobacter phytolaccae]|uniref:Uncharacterized protein n=1 Tax=Solirubrobacter phytolaccae TaxID=1404360 RepID=A0A9X3S7M8_9ACTN|nr:hypothetical protein [Solirubrobacter phytolaccae]MDA0179346.1 hypothetical protein [Solirubrobacter phytolaccae]
MPDPPLLHGVGDDVGFELRLAQAIAWCSTRWDPARPDWSLRTPSLRPSLLATGRGSTLRHLCELRVAWDRAVFDARAATSTADLHDGRLLVFAPDETLSDGAAEEATLGFLDEDNTPPWDTWIGVFHAQARLSPRWHDDAPLDYLVSWVPKDLVDRVTIGIEVNPEECLVWLEDSCVPLSTDCRARGLLAR